MPPTAPYDRQTFLLQLGDRIRDLADADAIVETTVDALGVHLGASRVVYAEIDADGHTARVVADWSDGSLPSLVGEHTLDPFGDALARHGRAGRARPGQGAHRESFTGCRCAASSAGRRIERIARVVFGVAPAIGIALQRLLLALAALLQVRRLAIAAVHAGIGAARLQVDLAVAAAGRRILEPAPRLRAARRTVLLAGVARIALLPIGVALVTPRGDLLLRRGAPRRSGLVVVLRRRHGVLLVSVHP